MKRSLQIVFAIALMGIAFSGALTLREFTTNTGGGCSALGRPGTIFGLPPCVYGLVMYTIVAIVSGLGLKKGT